MCFKDVRIVNIGSKQNDFCMKVLSSNSGCHGCQLTRSSNYDKIKPIPFGVKLYHWERRMNGYS